MAPGLRILSLLKKKHAEIYYNDPFVEEICSHKKYPELALKSQPLNYNKFSYYDAVIIVTDHSEYDWEKIVAHSQLVIDTKNVTSSVHGTKENVIKA